MVATALCWWEEFLFVVLMIMAGWLLLPMVVVAGVVLRVSPVEWAVLVLCIGVVLAAEAFNSAIERIADYLTLERDDRIRDIKDLAAGAVLLCAIAAATVGCVIFLPYVLFDLNGS